MESERITHRCEQLLEHNLISYPNVSIRYGYRYDNENTWYSSKQWFLDKLESDNDWGHSFMFPVTDIKFCPFCGKELEHVEETN